jgi:hypothetical protein
MKVGARKKEEILLYSWLPTGTYNWESGNIENKKLFKIWQIWVFFLYHREILSISRNLAKNLSVKETIGIELYKFQKCWNFRIFKKKIPKNKILCRDLF